MSGHPSIYEKINERENGVIVYGGSKYEIVLTINRYDNFNGDLVGIKFFDSLGSMDSSKKVHTNGIKLGIEIGKKVSEMLKELFIKNNNIKLVGFYLLTEDMTEKRAARKIEQYDLQAGIIHKKVSKFLPELFAFDANGGSAWCMGANKFLDQSQFKLFIDEIGKQVGIRNVN